MIGNSIEKRSAVDARAGIIMAILLAALTRCGQQSPVTGNSSSTIVAFLSHVQGRPVQAILHLPREWKSPAQFEAMLATLGLTNA